MCCTNIIYQKYLGTSIKVGKATHNLYASSGPKAEGVPTNNLRGQGSGPCRILGGSDKACHIVHTALLHCSQSVTLKELSVQGCKRAKRKTYSHLDDC